MGLTPFAIVLFAAALHARCLADPELNHPFSHPGQNPQHVAFATGQPDRFVAAAQLAAGKMEHERPEPYRLSGRRGRRVGALENIRHAQR